MLAHFVLSLALAGGDLVIVEEAKAAAPLAKTALGRAFLDAVPRLPAGEARTIYKKDRQWLPAVAFDALPEAERSAFQKMVWKADGFYTTKYGSPLAYLRAVELVGGQGWKSFEKRRVLDFGYGGLGQLRLMALAGAAAVGVDVDPFLAALYASPGDQGKLGEGDVKLVHGSWPKEVGAAVGGGFDLFVSKNTLKRGYLHPVQLVEERQRVRLGVEDEAFLRAVREALKPGGLALIYNLCPPQNPPDKEWIPWADGRCPFPRELWEKAGFEVLAYDVDDGPAARAMGRAIGWEKKMGDLEKQLFATYTLARRKE